MTLLCLPNDQLQETLSSALLSCSVRVQGQCGLVFWNISWPMLRLQDWNDMLQALPPTTDRKPWWLFRNSQLCSCIIVRWIILHY